MDTVNHPRHYTHGDIECADAMESAFGCEQLHLYSNINAFKYIWRSAEHSDGEQVNLRKAIWYLRKATEADGDI